MNPVRSKMTTKYLYTIEANTEFQMLPWSWKGSWF